MSTSVYVRSDSREKTVNVITKNLVKKIKIKMNTILLNKKKLVVNNPCTEKTCKNGGTCFADKLRQTKCFCKEGYDGKSCEIDKRTTNKTSTTERYGK